MTPRRRRIRTALAALVIVGAGLTGAGRLDTAPPDTAPPNTIGGPYARLLTQSVDLGPARSQPVQVTAELHRAANPARLREWAQDRHLTVRWRDGDTWAVIEGDSQALAAAFGVAVRDYRAEIGSEPRDFYASPQQPQVPAVARAEVSGLGRIISYTAYREGRPPRRAMCPTAACCPLSCGTPTT